MIQTLCLFLQFVMREILSNELKYLLYTKGVAVIFTHLLHVHDSLIHLLKYPC